jgi:hypothetical protein
VVLCVADTGCGMTPTAARQAFEPFFTTRARGGGSGLGLAIVGDFVRALGGHVEVVSTPGQGASIMLNFPAFTDRQPL